MDLTCHQCGISLAPPHLCSACHRPVCPSCVPSASYPSAAPLCFSCLSAVSEVKELAREEGLKWGEMSGKGRKWVEAGRSSQLRAAAKIGYADYLKQSPNLVDEESIHKDVLTGRTDPSTLDLELHHLLLPLDLTHYRSTISSVLRAYCVRNPQTGYCQGLNNVAMWLLLFMDPENAFWALCNLIERILTPGFYMGAKTGNSLNGFYIESTVIAALLDFCIPAVRENPLPITDFADCFSLQLLIQLFTVSLDFKSVLFLWDLLFAEGSIALVRGVLSLAFIFEAEISSGKHPSIIYQDISHARVYVKLTEIYPEVRKNVTSIRVERLRRQARDYRALQWLRDKDLVIRRLEYVSKFAREEILGVQREFTKILQLKRAKEDRARIVIRNSTRKTTVTLPNSMQADVTNIEGMVDIGITRPEFFTLLTNLDCKLTTHFDRIFDIFDEDQSGYLDFREVTVCLSTLLKGSFEDRLRVFFDVFDTRHTGSVLKPDFQRLLDAILLPLYESIEQSYEESKKEHIDTIYLSLIRLYENGSVQWSDFLSIVLRETEIRRSFEEYVAVRHSGLQGMFEGLVEDKPTAQVGNQSTASCMQCCQM